MSSSISRRRAVAGTVVATVALAALVAALGVPGRLATAIAHAQPSTVAHVLVLTVLAGAGGATYATIRHRQTTAHLRALALHDPLTALPNRLVLMDRLGQALARQPRSGGQVAVLYVDLDRFKTVNDTLGHAGGDALLIAVARRLHDLLRPGDTLARMAGDEFIIVCEGVHDRAGAAGIAERVRHAFADPFTVGARTLSANASIGVALTGANADSPERLLARADQALYAAKRRGGGEIALLDPARSA